MPTPTRGGTVVSKVTFAAGTPTEAGVATPTDVLLYSFIGSAALGSEPLLRFGIVMGVGTASVIRSFSSSNDGSSMLGAVRGSALLTGALFVSGTVLPSLASGTVFSVMFPGLSTPSVPMSSGFSRVSVV